LTRAGPGCCFNLIMMDVDFHAHQSTRLGACGLLALAGLFSCPALWALEAGDKAPDFTLPVLNGQVAHSLSTHLGDWVYVDFWASWCGPCRKSLPLYESLHQELSAGNFKVLAISVDELESDALAFLDDHPVSYTVLWDPSGATPAEWEVRAMPTSYLIDADGRIARIWSGFEDTHIQEIRDAMQSTGQ